MKRFSNICLLLKCLKSYFTSIEKKNIMLAFRYPRHKYIIGAVIESPMYIVGLHLKTDQLQLWVIPLRFVFSQLKKCVPTSSNC